MGITYLLPPKKKKTENGNENEEQRTKKGWWISSTISISKWYKTPLLTSSQNPLIRWVLMESRIPPGDPPTTIPKKPL